ncbi:FabD/lysophospholipase-like protein [Ceratobasidium sp. AG-I]|nr:FabD/lysophospholipase-like protein [Ceratobasidium sp. AG-I]
MRAIQAANRLAEVPRPCAWFHLIVGTGTGGLVAILLGRLGLTIDQAIDCYVEILRRAFRRRWFSWGNAFGAKELEQVVGEIVLRHCGRADARMIEDRGQEPGCRVMVCAMSTDAMRGSIPTCIRTYRVDAHQGPDCTIVEAVRATTATPGMFKQAWLREDGVKVPYVGGGLGCNNPAAQALNELERVFTGRHISTFVSVGSGQLHSAQMPTRSKLLSLLPWSLYNVVQSIATDCERTNQELSSRFSFVDNVYFRFNTEQGMQDIDQSDAGRLSEVQAHTRNYLRDPGVSLRMQAAATAMISGASTVKLLRGNLHAVQQSSLRIGRYPPPSQTFTGREDVLNQMDSYFSKGALLERRLFVLHGLGGAGKTQLALKFVHTHKDWFWDIFYIDATTRETISAGLIAIGKAANAGSTPDEALAWLVSQEKRWLLVFNNADDPNLNLHNFFPECAHGDILITTRNQQMVAHTTGPESSSRVGGMRPDDALQLLLKSSGDNSNEETITIAKKLVEVCVIAHIVSHLPLIGYCRSLATLHWQSSSPAHICALDSVGLPSTTRSFRLLEHACCVSARVYRRTTTNTRFLPLGRSTIGSSCLASPSCCTSCRLCITRASLSLSLKQLAPGRCPTQSISL